MRIVGGGQSEASLASFRSEVASASSPADAATEPPWTLTPRLPARETKAGPVSTLPRVPTRIRRPRRRDATFAATGTAAAVAAIAAEDIAAVRAEIPQALVRCRVLRAPRARVKM